MNGTAFTCCLALGLGLTLADTQEPTIEDTLVAGNIHMLTGQGGNIGLSIGPDGVLMIDDQYQHMAPAIQKAIEKAGGSAPRFLINTHWHLDHTGGNAVFGKNAVIVAHENVRARMQKGRQGQPPAPKHALPIVTYDDGVKLHFNGEDARLIAFPAGHTDGDTMVWFPQARVLHMGDHFFSGMFPFIDLDSGGDVAGYIKNVKSVLEWVPSDAKIIPGHGPLSTLKDLRTALAMLEKTSAIVRERIADGMDEAACVAAGLPAEFADWEWNFIGTDKWLTICYRSYSR